MRGRESNDMQMISGPDLNLPPGDNWVSVLHPHMQIRSALIFFATREMNKAWEI